jgi:tRNA pseudouridine38/39 synthase
VRDENPNSMDKIKVNKAKRNVPREELEKLEKEELVTMIIKLEAHNKQLKNILEKKVKPKNESSKRKESDRNFDHSKWNKRHILLKFCYLGWNYEGYVVQENTTETIEHQLFESLSKVCLIETRETSNYNRCGRTDKGVSAFEQVISIDVRSKVKPEDQLSLQGVRDEINYCQLLNKVLPREIRAISWQPLITQKFSARFDCIGRTYKYFFPRGDLKIEKMQEACKHLVGSHDFRNLCKMDVGNGVVNYIRRLDHVEIKLATRNHESLEPFDMLLLEIKGSAFL